MKVYNNKLLVYNKEIIYSRNIISDLFNILQEDAKYFYLIEFLKFVESYEIYNSNNNLRSKETMLKEAMRINNILGVSDFDNLCFLISNKDENNIIYKCLYDYLYKENDINSLEETKSESDSLNEHIYERLNTSRTLRNEILRNANGKCYLECNNYIFTTNNLTPYLEVHHILPVSLYKKDNQFYSGLDTIDNLVALCPTCHKRVHFENIQSAGYNEIQKLLYDKISKFAQDYNIETFNDYIQLLK